MSLAASVRVVGPRPPPAPPARPEPPPAPPCPAVLVPPRAPPAGAALASGGVSALLHAAIETAATTIIEIRKLIFISLTDRRRRRDGLPERARKIRGGQVEVVNGTNGARLGVQHGKLRI